jgi:hypothetical protein
VVEVSKGREPVEVEILDVREVVTYPAPGKTAVTRIVTYRYGDMPPRSVFIPAAEDTPENRARIIREDIERAKAFQPQKMRV